ncbi:MAG: hypothetical protein DWI10_06835 [Planctomycetota bacterium]|nr:MAG: hypothetical protein DWI10_06835 [Planctomycetota bacterium]
MGTSCPGDKPVCHMADLFSLSERAGFRKHNFQTFARGQFLQFLRSSPKQRAEQTRQRACTI